MTRGNGTERNGGSETLPSKPTSHQSWGPARAAKPLCHTELPDTIATGIPAGATSFYLLPSTGPPHLKPFLSSPKSNDWFRPKPLPHDANAIPISPSGYAPPTTKPSNLIHWFTAATDNWFTAATDNYSAPLWVHKPKPECCNKQKQPLHPELNPASTKINFKLKTPSRRLSQRRSKRLAKKRLKNMTCNSQTNTHLQCVKHHCLQSFGFCADPCLTLQKNFNTALCTFNPPGSYQQPRNLSFHNLCESNSLPAGARALLGLNLKFCLAHRTITNDLNRTLLKMARSIRTHYFLQENGSANASQYIKQLYVKNSNWHPPPAPINVEDKITEFEKALKVKHNHLTAKHKRINLSNLTPIQAQTLRLLKRNKNIVIKPTDKNLGPAVLDTNDYVEKILKEHLLTNAYKQLTRTEMLNSMTDLKSALTNTIQSNADKLSQAELTFFKRSLTSHFRLPIFYGLPKVHKNPVALRPVVSTTNSLLAIFSTWLDYKMKELLPYVKSYIKNSTEVILDLKDLHIPQNTKLFSADAVSM